MISPNLITGIIAARLGYTRAEAAGLVPMLTEDDREDIELAARRSPSPVAIAAIVCRALQRAADQIKDPETRAAAQDFAAKHAARMNVEIQSLPLERNEPGAPPPKSPGPRLRQIALPAAGELSD